MLLAGDLGGTKTIIGLFKPSAARPALIDSRTYRTLDYDNLGSLTAQFLRDTGTRASEIEAASFGVAGPVDGTRARLTNVPWVVDIEEFRQDVSIARGHLLNDLEALAWSIPVLNADEIAVLHEGATDPRGTVGLIAAGTGLGIAVIPNIDGRLVPRASEGGHADFAARNADEQTLAAALAAEFGRVDVERVVSGRGLTHIHRVLFPHTCATTEATDHLSAAITRGALEGGCPHCTRTLEVFVSAYGAAAGNLALTVLSTGGMYLGGGIAPRILPALRWPVFMHAFQNKSPMDALITRIPVKVILNPGAGLLGAATFALNHWRPVVP
jgi:glucokinase